MCLVTPGEAALLEALVNAKGHIIRDLEEAGQSRRQLRVCRVHTEVERDVTS